MKGERAALPDSFENEVTEPTHEHFPIFQKPVYPGLHAE